MAVCACIATLGASCRSPQNSPAWTVDDWRWFGVGLAAVGDVDADGTPDLFVADTRSGCLQSNPPRHHGAAWVLSGKDGKVLWHVQSLDADDRFGCSAAGLGDVDGDGHDDWIVGSEPPHAEQRGFAEVYSGRTRARLFRFEGGAGFGRWVGAAGDVDGDGRPDAVVSGPHVGRSGDAHFATVFSGSNGRFLRCLSAPDRCDELAANPIGLGDLDDDGRSEIALLVDTARGGPLQIRVHPSRSELPVRTVGTFQPDPRALRPLDERYQLSLGGSDTDDHRPLLISWSGGTGILMAPRDGRVILEHACGPTMDIEIRAGMASPGDIDGDGTSDLLFAHDCAGVAEGRVFARSGRDGRILYVIGRDRPGDVDLPTWHFGASLVSVGDVDGDGVGDVLVGTDCTFSIAPGCAFLFSGKSGTRIFSMQRRGSEVVVTR